ncbi:MAG TPA: hypothetical protein VKK31_04650 [Thermoanaerobaculia bacterium]|nr:hypothetical protein [Thermoanaerobaculia bacterium]
MENWHCQQKNRVILRIGDAGQASPKNRCNGAPTGASKGEFNLKSRGKKKPYALAACAAAYLLRTRCTLDAQGQLMRFLQNVIQEAAERSPPLPGSRFRRY